MGALTKKNIVDRVVSTVDISGNETKLLVDDFFKTLVETLSDTEEIKLSGFGKFELRDKCSRPGRNPKTLAPAEISARRVVTFQAGQKLRDRVDAYKPENQAVVEVRDDG